MSYIYNLSGLLMLITGWFWFQRYRVRRRALRNGNIPAAYPFTRKPTTWQDYLARSFFVYLFLGLHFLFAPSMIPSASMDPTLPVGKVYFHTPFPYGIRAPFVGWVIRWHTPSVGDIIVFSPPRQRSFLFVKRVIATAGQTVTYGVKNQQLSIDGVPVARTPIPTLPGLQFEHSGSRQHVVKYDDAPFEIQPGVKFAQKEFCEFAVERVRCTVPSGFVFVMGDHRDDSIDSRSFGFVDIHDVYSKVVLS